MEIYTAGLSFDEFSGNFMVIEACLYNIQVIGEATGQLPDDVRAINSGIPWNLIKGMRNRLIHEYFGTDLQLVWNVITAELPALKNSFKDIHAFLHKEGR